MCAGALDPDRLPLARPTLRVYFSQAVSPARWIPAVLLLVASILGDAPAFADGPAGCGPGTTPTFQRGFAELRELIGEPMGDPITCELPDPRGTGDVHQLTTRGLAYWRKATNTPTFTNGSERWAITTAGFLYWQGRSIDPPRYVISGFSTDPLRGYQGAGQLLAPSVVQRSLEGPTPVAARSAVAPAPFAAREPVPVPLIRQYLSGQMAGVLILAGAVGLLLVLQHDLKARRERWHRESRRLATYSLALEDRRQVRGR